MRTILAIRHAHSTANEPEVPSGMRADELAFANMSADLTPRGEIECAQLADVLPVEYGITVQDTPVAVSKFVRTQRTAKLKQLCTKRRVKVYG